MSKQCNVPECQGKHHSLLHCWVKPESDRTAFQPSVNWASTKDSLLKAYLGIIPVKVTGINGNTCETYALIDDGADKSLCDVRLLKKLRQPGKPVDFKITTVNSSGSSVSGSEGNLRVQSASGSDVLDLKVWSV